MSERPIPYRTLRRQETEVAVQLIVAAVGGLVTQQYFPEFAVFGAVGTYFAAMLLYSLWTHVAGFERVTAAEHHRRQMLERAQRPVWVEVLNQGAGIGALAVVGALFALPPEYYAALPLIVGASLLAGAFFGLYLAVDARREMGTSGTPRQPLSFAESIGRHVTGYAMGLAGALAVAAAVDDPSLAVVAMLIAFLSAKFASDTLLTGGASLHAESDERLRWYHFVLAFPMGAIWWGLPFGVLGVLVTLSVNPDAPSHVLLWVFIGALVVTGLMATVATAMAVMMGLVPRKAPPS